MEGLELAARFSSAPNRLGLCGPKKFDLLDAENLAAKMKKFRAPYAYLCAIADANGLEPFDYKCAEAFWLGNKLLGKVARDDIADVITKKFTGNNGLPKPWANQLASCLPKQVFPHHSFHVFYVRSISGVLEGKTKELDLCRVSWGRVTRVGKEKISACSKPIAFSDGKAAFARRKAVSWRILGSQIYHAGDIACSHWGVAVMPITRAQEKNLQKYTTLNMGLYWTRPKRG